jgi:hypothetical protein
LLLEGLAQVLVRDANLDQLPIEPRDPVLPLLEGVLRPLERGALLLEPTQHLPLRQALPLKHSPGFGESSLLSLELGFRLLTRGSLLTELLLHRGERSTLAHQGRPKPLGLLGLLLGLTLPGLRPLEGRAVLLELGASRGDLDLPRRRNGTCPARSSRALRSASSRFTSAVITFSTAETSPVPWASCPGG